MKWIIIIIVAVGLYLIFKKSSIKRSSKKQTKPPDIKISLSVDTSTSNGFDNPDTGPIIPSNDGGWILNPKSTFPLTIHGVNRATAEEFKQLLDSGYSLGSYQVVQSIMPIVTRYNIRCKEIDDYVRKFKRLYLEKIEELKKNSTEWATVSDLDKEDLLAEFRGEAISSLDIQPDCDLEILFEGEALDVTIDDILIDRFGYDAVRFYLVKKKGVHIIPADHYDRKMFEKLVEVGLAIRGENIPITSILESLKLKQLSALVSDLNPPKFSRKAKAIEYLTKLPDLKDRLNRIVSFRTLFMLQPLPGEFSHIDLNQVSTAWQYAQEVSMLIYGTYVHAGYATRNQHQHINMDDSLIKGWEISAIDDNRCCPYCKKASTKKYPKRYPTVPLHIGCRCHISPILRD